MAGNSEATAPFTRSTALFDAAGALVSWDAGFEVEFLGAKDLLAPGVAYRTLVKAARQRISQFRTLGGQVVDSEVMRCHEERYGPFGTRRSFLYRNPNDQVVRVDETVSVNGDVFRVSEDVTEDWNARRELAQAKEHLAAADEVATGVAFSFTVAADGQVTLPQPTAAANRIHGYPDDFDMPDSIGLYTYIEMTAEERVAVTNEARRSLETLEPLVFEYPIRGNDGNRRWIRHNLLPRRLQDGSTVFEGVMRDITREKLAQDQIELLRSVVVYSSDSVVIMETNAAGQTTILYVNPAFERLYGYTLAELAGRDVGEYTHLKVDQITELELRRRRMAGSTEPLEIQLSHRDNPVWIELRICKFQVRGDGSYSWATISRDITERKRAADELARSERMLAEAQRMAKIGTWEVDVPSGEVRWSEGIYHLLGLDPKSCSPSSELFFAATHPDDLEAVVKSTERMHAGEIGISGGFRIVRPDGAERFLDTETQLVRDETGKVTRTLGTIQDITERKRAADELALSERMLAEAERIAKIGTFEVDFESGQHRWSRELYSLLDVDPDTCFAGPELFMSKVHPDDFDRLVVQTNRILSGDEDCTFDDYRIVRSDGTERFLHGRIEYLKDDGGRVVRALGTIQDVTEHKLAADKLARSERMLSEAQRIAKIGNWEADLLSGELRWSEAMYDLIGLDPESTTPSVDLIMGAIHPDDRDRLALATEQVFAADENFELSSFRIIRPDGDERIIHGQFVPVKDGSGRATRVIGTVQDITERKLAADELARSERLLSEAQRIAKIGNWEVDLQSGEVTWSDGLYELIGLDPKSVSPSVDLFVAAIHPDDRDLGNQAAEHVFAADENFKMSNFRIVRPDGDELVIHAENMLVKDETGRATRVIGTVQDVTERKLAADELARSERMLTEAQRMAKIGNWEVELQTGELRWSDALYDLLGLDPSSPPSVDLSIAGIHPDDRDRAVRTAESIFAGDETHAASTYRIIRPDGTERTLHVEFVQMKDGSGKATRVIGSVQDVTERKQAADELAHSEHMLTEAQRMAKIGNWEANLRTGELRWSRGLYHLLGIDPKIPPSSDLFMSAVHPDDRDLVLGETERILSGGEDHMTTTYRLLRPDGTERFIHREIQLVRDATGKPVRLAGTAQDVTLQRAAELELRNAFELAKSADRAKSEFLANMSHELRTPLNAIIGFSELLMIDAGKGVQQEKQEEYLRDIYNSGQHLLEIINGILSLSKIEAGRTVLEEELFDLAEVVDWTFRLLVDKAQGAGVVLKAECEADLPRLFGDPRLIRQALLNLVSNATKFSNPGGHVQVLAKLNVTGEMVIIVSDSGIGMTSDQVAVALTPFGQVESALQRKYEGTGLGLPLAKKFIELHGGQLTIESTPHEGTKVTVVMPRSRCAYPSELPAATRLRCAVS